MARSNSVQSTLRDAFTVVLIACSCFNAEAKARKTAHPKQKNDKNTEREAATRLQVFLDRANFSPGKLDGHYGEFTLRALALYRQSRGEQPAPIAPGKSAGKPPNLDGLDLKSVDPVFVTYTVTDTDLQ